MTICYISKINNDKFVLIISVSKVILLMINVA